MNTIQRIAKNTLSLLSAQIFITILSFILSTYIARSLGETIFGVYSFAIVFSSIFAIFSDLGYNTLLIKEVARDKSIVGKYVNNVLTIRLLLSPIIFFMIVVITNLMNYPAETKKIVYLFGISTLFDSLSAIFHVTFRAFEKMEYEAAIRIVSNTVRITISLLCLFLGYGLVEIAFVFLFSSVFEFLVSFLTTYRRIIKPKLAFDFNFWKTSMRIALTLGMLSLFNIIFGRIDIVMLSNMKGDAAVGWYNAAYIFITGFTFIPHLFMNVLFPLLSNYHVSSQKSLKIVYEKSVIYMYILGLPLAAGIITLADKIILFIYGYQFYPSIISLQILGIDILLVFLYTCLGFILVSINKQNQMALIMGSAALLNIVLNLILIPSFSYVGAGIATVITEVTLLGLYYYNISKYLCPISQYGKFIRGLIACFGMVIFINFFNGVNLIVLILSSGGVYFLLLYLMNFFSSDDIEMITKIIKIK